MIIAKDGTFLDPLWEAEFRGFFFGEGYLGITSNGYGRNGYRHYLARAQITLRDDDASILYQIQKKLGGCVYVEKKGRSSKSSNGELYQSNPYIVWRVGSREDVTRICNILEKSLLPSKKKQEIVIMRLFLNTLGIKNGPKSEEEKVELNRVQLVRSSLASQLKKMHAYQL